MAFKIKLVFGFFWTILNDVLIITIVGAEALLKSRPFTHVSVNPNDLEAITPNHFLLLRAHPWCNLDVNLDLTTSPGADYALLEQVAQRIFSQHHWNKKMASFVKKSHSQRLSSWRHPGFPSRIMANQWRHQFPARCRRIFPILRRQGRSSHSKHPQASPRITRR